MMTTSATLDDASEKKGGKWESANVESPTELSHVHVGLLFAARV
jgi:hypothetical protein